MAVPMDDVVIPALLRAARGSYARVIAVYLVDAGFDDLPRNGAFVLGGMANWGGSAADMIRGLDVSKQVASQLIDALVLRGYLTREINPEDRRRMLMACWRSLWQARGESGDSLNSVLGARLRRWSASCPT